MNSWEASYFDINERKLLALAKAGKEAGIELFVMDDGWFGERNDDKHSLGDWDVNPKNCRVVLSGICEKVKALGFIVWYLGGAGDGKCRQQTLRKTSGLDHRDSGTCPFRRTQPENTGFDTD